MVDAIIHCDVCGVFFNQHHHICICGDLDYQDAKRKDEIERKLGGVQRFHAWKLVCARVKNAPRLTEFRKLMGDT